MTVGSVPRQASLHDDECKSPSSANLLLAKKIWNEGTPTFLFPDNSRITGFATAKQIEARLK
jgi:protein-disulfide isomerase